MNERDLFAAIGETPENLLEASEKKPGKKWIIYLAAAACLCLILAIALQYVHPPALPGQKISMEKIWWVQESEQCYQRVDNALECLPPDAYFHNNQFVHLMSIEAKVLDVLPDVYAVPGVESYQMRYHVLRLAVRDAINAENMPSEIYCLLPQFLSTDLKRFDSLILTVNQKGLENYLLINTTRQWMETFDFVFYPNYNDGVGPHEGAVLAFTDGVLDMSLWEMDGWNSSDDIQYYLNPETKSSYPAKIGSTIDQVKERILEELPSIGWKYGMQRVVSNADCDWPEAQALLERIAPFENGYYQVTLEYSYYHKRSLNIRQFVNGAWTTQTIVVDIEEKTIKEYGADFTTSDKLRAPSLASAIKKASKTSPPKEDYQYLGYNPLYLKRGDKIFGVVCISWGYVKAEPEYGYHIGGYIGAPLAAPCDTTWILVYPEGSMEECAGEKEAYELIEEYLSK
ncbi:MAG: hypothetical protein E7439_02360 [Ruminococcaceae bacterium]|nr:hypothetical protein [Oscillospiraceae bacterium]